HIRLLRWVLPGARLDGAKPDHVHGKPRRAAPDVQKPPARQPEGRLRRQAVAHSVGPYEDGGGVFLYDSGPQDDVAVRRAWLRRGHRVQRSDRGEASCLGPPERPVTGEALQDLAGVADVTQ